MSNDRNPELPEAWLTPYFEGELPGHLHDQVEAWLADHPEALDRLDEDRRLDRLFDQTSPPEPEPEEWSRLLTGISQRLSAAETPAARATLPGPRLWAASAAAILLLALGATTLWLNRSSHTQPATAQDRPVVVEPLAVSGDDDVVIISMEASDVNALVVGAPPVRGPLVLASSGDVHVEHMSPYRDGALPELHQPAGGTPMVVGPLDQPWDGD